MHLEVNKNFNEADSKHNIVVEFFEKVLITIMFKINYNLI